MGFGKRESPPMPSFQEVTSKTVRQFRSPSPRALEVPSIGTAKTIKAALVYCTIFFGCVGAASLLLFVENPLSYARAPISLIDHLFE
jgi:hypothetical protein